MNNLTLDYQSVDPNLNESIEQPQALETEEKKRRKKRRRHRVRKHSP